MNITKDESKKDLLILRLQGRLDAVTSVQLENNVNQEMEKSFTKILLDCAEIDYLSSAGMRVLLSATKRLKAAGGFLKIHSLHDDVKEIIHLAGFEKILMIYNDEQGALS